MSWTSFAVRNPFVSVKSRGVGGCVVDAFSAQPVVGKRLLLRGAAARFYNNMLGRNEQRLLRCDAATTLLRCPCWTAGGIRLSPPSATTSTIRNFGASGPLRTSEQPDGVASQQTMKSNMKLSALQHRCLSAKFASRSKCPSLSSITRFMDVATRTLGRPVYVRSAFSQTNWPPLAARMH